MSAASNGSVWTAAGINLAATALVATVAVTTLTNQWSTAETLGKHEASIGTVLDEVKSTKAIITSMEARTTDIQRQIVASRLDIGTMMAKAGVPIDRNVELVSIGNQVVAFPQTPEAAQVLKDRNFEQVQVTPAVGGYVIDEASASIVRDIINLATEPASAANGVVGVNDPSKFKVPKF